MQFPIIPLTDLEGVETTLLNLLKEEHLNLILFYNNDCLGCTGRALPLAYELQQEYSFIQLIVVHSTFGQRSYSIDDLKGIFTSGEAPFPIYREPTHELYDFFDCNGTPHWILMDDKGNVTHSIFGSQDGAQMKLDFAIREFEDRLG